MKEKKAKNLDKFYKLQKHETCSKKSACNNHLKKQETNGEGTIALSQMSSTFQLPIKKSGHHFCFFLKSFIAFFIYGSP